MAGNKAGLGESFAGNLALPLAGGGISPPGDFPGGNIVITGNFSGDPAAFLAIDPDDLLKVAVVVTDPFSFESEMRRNWAGHIRKVGGHRPAATRGWLCRRGDMEDGRWEVEFEKAGTRMKLGKACPHR
jgi:hypothetical protein